MRALPPHWRALRMPVEPVAAQQLLEGILYPVRWDGYLFHPELVAGKKEWDPPEG
ncbi:hypothetical protein [Nitrospira sp. Nam74]